MLVALDFGAKSHVLNGCLQHVSVKGQPIPSKKGAPKQLVGRTSPFFGLPVTRL